MSDRISTEKILSSRTSELIRGLSFPLHVCLIRRIADHELEQHKSVVRLLHSLGSSTKRERASGVCYKVTIIFHRLPKNVPQQSHRIRVNTTTLIDSPNDLSVILLHVIRLSRQLSPHLSSAAKIG